MAETESRESLEHDLEDAVEAVHERAADTDGAAEGFLTAVEPLVDAYPALHEAEKAEREARGEVLDLRRELGQRPDGQAPSVDLPDGPEARLRRRGGRVAVEVAHVLRKAAARGEL